MRTEPDERRRGFARDVTPTKVAEPLPVQSGQAHVEVVYFDLVIEQTFAQAGALSLEVKRGGCAEDKIDNQCHADVFHDGVHHRLSDSRGVRQSHRHAVEHVDDLTTHVGQPAGERTANLVVEVAA